MTKITSLELLLRLNARDENGSSYSSMHRAIQDVGLGALCSNFIEKRERSNNC